jgi:peptidoglycan biosynthesis protein MviN/MurJ (putative lipid II flippase)
MILSLQALNILAIVLAFLFQLLFLRVFGSSAQTDAFYLSLTITQFSTNLLTGFLTDMYIPLYHDLKAQDEQDAEWFASSVSSVAMLGGVVIAASAIAAAPMVVKVFATGFDEAQTATTVEILRWLAIAIPFQIGVVVLTSVHQANLDLKVPYVANALQPAIQLLAIVLIVPIAGMSAVVVSVVVSVACAFFTLVVWRGRRVGFLRLWSLYHPALPELLKRNVPIRFGNIIYLLKGPLSTNVLSALPAGSLTLYQYAEKILQTTFSVSNGPVLQILYARGSMLLSLLRVDDVRTLLRSVVRSNTTLTVSIILLLSTFFLPVFDRVLSARLTVVELTQLFLILVTLIPYYCILSLEAPFVNVLFSLKMGSRIVEVNIWFILLFAGGVYLLFPALGLYALPMALAVAQSQNAMRFASLVHGRLQVFETILKQLMLKTLIIILGSVILNSYFAEHRSVALLVNIGLVVVWTAMAKEDVRFAFKFLRTRGEAI